ncbi:hypothetical protein QUB52_16070 [Microcoleus sp. A6-C6]
MIFTKFTNTRFHIAQTLATSQPACVINKSLWKILNRQKFDDGYK